MRLFNKVVSLVLTVFIVLGAFGMVAVSAASVAKNVNYAGAVLNADKPYLMVTENKAVPTTLASAKSTPPEGYVLLATFDPATATLTYNHGYEKVTLDGGLVPELGWQSYVEMQPDGLGYLRGIKADGNLTLDLNGYNNALYANWNAPIKNTQVRAIEVDGNFTVKGNGHFKITAHAPFSDNGMTYHGFGIKATGDINILGGSLLIYNYPYNTPCGTTTFLHAGGKITFDKATVILRTPRWADYTTKYNKAVTYKSGDYTVTQEDYIEICNALGHYADRGFEYGNKYNQTFTYTGTKFFSVKFLDANGIEIGEDEKRQNNYVDLSEYAFGDPENPITEWYTDKDCTIPAKNFSIADNTKLYSKYVVKSEEESNRPDNMPEILATDHYAYVMGREGNKICPEDYITRAEVATIYYRLLTSKAREGNSTKANAFDDIKTTDWYCTAVSTLSRMGIINGRSENVFAPDALITRAEFATITARLSEKEVEGESMFDDTKGHWAEANINKAATFGWIVGENGVFRPDDNITRAEVMTIVNRVLGRLPETKDDLLDVMITWTDNNPDAWYYLAVQEATNSHNCTIKEDGVHEKWTSLTETPEF